MIDNRLCFFNDLNHDWLNRLSNNLRRLDLKKHFKMAAHQVVVFHLGGPIIISSKSPALLTTRGNPDGFFKIPDKDAMK